MPAITTRPPGLTASTAASTACCMPAASIATSSPKPPAAFAIARASFPSAGKTRAPRARAASSRCGREARSVAKSVAAPASASGLQDEEADRPAAEDADGHARADVGEVDRVQRHAEGLEHRAVGRGEALGQRDQAVARPGHPLAHRAVVLAEPGEADLRTQVRVAFMAQGALPHAIAGSIATSCPSSVRPAISWPGPGARGGARRSRPPRRSGGPSRRDRSPRLARASRRRPGRGGPRRGSGRLSRREGARPSWALPHFWP